MATRGECTTRQRRLDGKASDIDVGRCRRVATSVAARVVGTHARTYALEPQDYIYTGTRGKDEAADPPPCRAPQGNDPAYACMCPG
jgi:hypothetical protein